MRWEWAYLFDQNTNSNYWSLYCRLSRAVCLVKQSFDKSVVLTEHEVQLQEVYRITGWCLLNKGISLSWELEWRFRLKFSAENVWNVCNVRNVWTLSRLASILFLTLSYFRLPYDFRYSNVFSEDLNGREIRARYLSPRTNMLIWLIFIYILAWTALNFNYIYRIFAILLSILITIAKHKEQGELLCTILSFFAFWATLFGLQVRRQKYIDHIW